MRKTESNSGRSRLKTYLLLTALAGYPALIHFSFAFDRPLIVAGMWLAVAVVGLGLAIRRASVPSALFFGALISAAIVLWWWGKAVDVMFLPPVLVNLGLMVLFGKTLLSGATPLVSRVASLWRGTLDPVVSRYTRRVTIAWTVFFALMALESIGLALFTPVHVWSFFTNFLNYVLVSLFFVVEYQLRFVCLPNHKHLTFRAFCRLMISTDFRTLAR
ncbi:MAG: hypothetical protein QNL90_10005 [Gammaproteobacteria bacterium]|nr:hypothetical protein [Gammaproteobacteria bacterium]MDX2460437.1 hypothetical protein [Gammaproteobacteria bacterium]